MTLIEENFFRRTPRQEYLHKAWEKPEKGKAPNVVRWIQRFNQVRTPSLITSALVFYLLC